MQIEFNYWYEAWEINWYESFMQVYRDWRKFDEAEGAWNSIHEGSCEYSYVF